MSGLIALALAMGIGRFAFTPLLPMMQAESVLGVTQGGWLASANYVGYFAGAVAALRLPWTPGASVRASLLVVAATTAAMAVTNSFAAWLALRFTAGVASAWVLVFVSSWGFERPGVVFSGVGAGIAVTGLACLALMAYGEQSETAWITLGGLAFIGAGALWPAFRARPLAATASAGTPFTWTREARRLVACYAAFGFGYIVPATFLPALARQAMDDPALFGWSWPVFGAAAAASTLVAGGLRHRVGDRRLWSAAHAVMAFGVVLSLPWLPESPRATLALVVASALLVGGTFMVATMAGIQEARRIAGPGARTLVAAMTSAFAAGQIAGPLVVSTAGGLTLPLVLAATLLLGSAYYLWRSP